MNKSYETIQFGDALANADRSGIIIAWSVSHQLTEANFARENASAVSRLSLEDMTGAEFFTMALHREFGSAFLNQREQDFVEDYFLSGTYDHDYNQVKAYTADEGLFCNQVFLEIPKLTESSSSLHQYGRN